MVSIQRDTLYIIMQIKTEIVKYIMNMEMINWRM
jgi:hypothetical protein